VGTTQVALNTTNGSQEPPPAPSAKSIASLSDAASNVKPISGPSDTTPEVWNAITAVMGTSDITGYQARSNYKSFPLKQDGKIGAMTLTCILSDALEILASGLSKDSQKKSQLLETFSKIYGSNDEATLIEKISEELVRIKSSQSLKFYMEIGLVLENGSEDDKNNFAIMWGLQNWEDYLNTLSQKKVDSKNNRHYGPLDTSKFQELNNTARQAVDTYLGREISDDEWSHLIRATYAESSPNSQERGYVAEVILNRAKSSGSIITTLYQRNQFQAVTGTSQNGRKPTQMFIQGPKPTSHQDILQALIDHLPHATGRLMNFTAANPAAYGPGTNIGFLYELKSRGRQVGQTVFA
jgi:hypothetical protein